MICGILRVRFNCIDVLFCAYLLWSAAVVVQIALIDIKVVAVKMFLYIPSDSVNV